MSLCAFRLKIGDSIIFGEEIVRWVTDIKEEPDPYGLGERTYILDGSLALHEDDPLWDLSRLAERPGFPLELKTARLDCTGNYSNRFFCWTPKQLLRALCEDIATLQAAGVEGGLE